MAILNGHEVVFVKPTYFMPDWQDTITDSWEKIIENANAGTVSGYSVGDTKTIEFIYNNIPLAARLILADKSHDTISGTSDKAALTFMFNDLLLVLRMNTTNTNAGGYMGENGDLYSVSLDETDGELLHGCLGRKTLWQIYKSFPENIQTAIKTVDKIYDDDNVLQTAKEKLFLPCLEEMGLTHTGYITGQGTQYALFSTSASRTKNGFGNNAYFTRSRLSTGTTSFYQTRADNGNYTSGRAGEYFAFCPCFCL